MKIRISTFLITLGLVSFLSACQNDKAIQDTLQKEVLDEHDTVMARMDDLNESQLKLDQLKSNFKNMNAMDTASLSLSIDSAKQALSQADEAMMQWMHQFSPDYTNMSNEQIINYLKQQRKSIDSVKVLFDQSLSRSKQIIEKHQ